MPHPSYSCALVSRLSRLYAAALGALALLAIVGQAFVQSQLFQQTGDAHIVNIAGRQRMLSQKISKAALALSAARSDTDRLRRHDELRDALILWESAQQGLRYGNPAENLPSSDASLLPWFTAIDPSFQTTRQAARRLLDAPNPAALAALLDAEPVFLTRMNALVDEYDRQARARVASLRSLEFGLLGLTLLVLALEVFWVFRPAARMVRESMAGREDAMEALRVQQGQMEDAAAQLTDVNALFSQASRRFQELFQGLPVACFCYDAQGKIIEWNRAFEALCWPEAGSPLQKPIWETICRLEDKERIQSLVEAVFAGESLSDLEWATDKKSYLCSTFPLRDSDGIIVGGICAKVDVTARKHAEEAVRRHNERLHTLYNTTSAPQISSGRKVDALLAMGCAQFGTDCGLLINQTGEVLHLCAPSHPDASAMPVTLALGATLAVSQKDSGRRNFFRPLLPDMQTLACAPVLVAGQPWGALCFASTRKTAFADADSEFMRLMAQWIGGEMERAQAEQATAESEERFRQAISAMQEGLVLTLRDGTVSICNESAARILETSPEQLAARGLIAPTWRVVREDQTAFVSEDRPTQMAFRTGKPQRDVAMGVHKTDDEWVWLLVNSMPMFHADEPTPYAVATTFTDITQRRRSERQLQEKMTEIQDYSAALEFQARELEKANAQLEALATLDGLTSLKNHRAFQERLAEEVGRSGRYRPVLSMLMLDVDHFKAYNDTYGHPAGDEVLKMVARLLRDETRETDFVARYGGEEFVVILPHTDSAGALAIGERLRAAIARAPWPQHPVTASFGVATLNLHCVSGADLVAEADQALYFSKSSGRNCVRHANELPASVWGDLSPEAIDV